MRREARQWTVAFAAALAAHGIVAAAMFWRAGTSGALGAGSGGLLVSFAGTGGDASAGRRGSPTASGAGAASEAAADESPSPSAARRPEPAPRPQPEPWKPSESRSSPPQPAKEKNVRPVASASVREKPKPLPSNAVVADTPSSRSQAPDADGQTARKPSSRSTTNADSSTKSDDRPSEAANAAGNRDAAADGRGSATGSVTGAGEGTGPESASGGGGGGGAGGGPPGTKQDYVALLRAWLEEHKRFPKSAELRRQQGTALLYLALDRAGRVLEYRLEKSSGHNLLDREVVDLVERAVPFPPMPPEMGGSRFEMVVPVQFFLR